MTHYFFIKFRYPKGSWQVDAGIYRTETLAKSALMARKDRFHLTEETKLCKCWRKL